jgi:hypothetical protein
MQDVDSDQRRMKAHKREGVRRWNLGHTCQLAKEKKEV